MEVLGPLKTVQLPVPTAGIFPERIALPEVQMVCVELFVAVVGSELLFITTSSVEAAHTPFEIVHRSVTLEPIVKPVTPEVGEAGVVIVAGGTITLQAPVPTVGVFPAKVAIVTLQMF